MENTKAKNLLIVILIILLLVCLGVIFMQYIDTHNVTKGSSDGKVEQNTTEIKNEEVKGESNDSQIEQNTEENNKYSVISDNLKEKDVLFVTNVIKREDSYTLRGVIYTEYTLSKDELQQVVNKGVIEIEGEEYNIVKNEQYGEYELYLKGEEDARYKIKSKGNGIYYLETQAQISTNWELTNEYKEITLSKDVKCSMLFDAEGKYNTVDDVFNGLAETEPKETKNPERKRAFIFKFENGKCIEVINVLTSME